MNDIYISVVVPIYNVEQYLAECLDSLAAQTLKNIEVFLINDGTKDNSGEIAKSYVEKYPEIFSYYEKENGGLSDARNYAFPYIKGKYVAYVDSDDYVAKDMMEKLWNAAKDCDAEIAECELDKVYSDKSERIVLPQKYETIKDYMLNSRVCAWNKLYKVEWLNKIGAEFPKGLLYEDLCLFYKIMPYLSVMPVTVHEPLYFYRQREGSILSNSDNRILHIHNVFDSVFDFYNERGLAEEYDDTAEYKYVRTLFCSFLIRMLKIKDKQLRSEVINESWRIVNEKRPNWKKNPYLKKLTSKNIYLKLMSRPVLSIMKLIIR